MGNKKCRIYAACGVSQTPITGEYQRGEIEFKVPLSKVQLFKLKKVTTEEENIFTENIEGKCLDIDL